MNLIFWGLAVLIPIVSIHLSSTGLKKVYADYDRLEYEGVDILSNSSVKLRMANVYLKYSKLRAFLSSIVLVLLLFIFFQNPFTGIFQEIMSLTLNAVLYLANSILFIQALLDIQFPLCNDKAIS